MRTAMSLLVILSFVFSLYSCTKENINVAPAVANPPVTQPVIPAPAGEIPYTLVWSDEFNTEGLPDTTKWGYDVGNNGWGNNELEYYTKARSENARVINGSLTIEARKEIYNNNKYYTSARLITKKKAEWTYGKFEIRAKIPKGRGTWPTIWLLSAHDPMNWPLDGELDIMEAVGFNPNMIYGTSHTQQNHGGNGKGGTKYIHDAQDSFHVYSIEWTDQKITWAIDSTTYYTYNNPGLGPDSWPYDKSFYLILNIAIGGNFGGKQGVDDSIFPQQMLIDYVRVYQKK